MEPYTLSAPIALALDTSRDPTAGASRLFYFPQFDIDTKEQLTMTQNLTQCYDLLNKTGRALEVSIDHLDGELRDALCLHYLVLRAVDTIEDDMTIPDDTKVTMLTSFGEYLLDPDWKYTESNDEYGIVLEKFQCDTDLGSRVDLMKKQRTPTKRQHIITQAIRESPRKYRDIIMECGRHIAQGMANFVGRELMTKEDMNEYCRSVSEVFCTGVARLFVASRLETEILVQDKPLLEHFSKFTQKVNSLRDFRKDWLCGRLYFTKDVWSKCVNNPGDFLKPENFHKGVECVNELSTDALQHVIPTLRFLARMRSPSAIKAFGIHMMMAISTLECCYNNPRVFMESVKIGRDVTVNIVESASSFTGIIDKVRHYIERMMQRTSQATGAIKNTMDICRQILNQIELVKSD